MTTPETVQEFISEFCVAISVAPIFQRFDTCGDNFNNNANHFQVRIFCEDPSRLDGKESAFVCNYSQGFACSTKKSEMLFSVLCSLVMETSSGDLSFAEFCSDFGYDQDSIRALNVYKESTKNTDRLKLWLGVDFDMFCALQED